MATVSRGLPKRPHLDVPKREARDLLKQLRAGHTEALERLRRRQSKFHREAFRLSDAQLAIAREYGFSTWAKLKERINANTVVGLLDTAIRANDGETVIRILKAHPKLLDIPLVSGNWGPPMSHAANLGQFEMVKTIASLGAKDFQHAFDRALLQGELECARWLHEHGGKLEPGIIMGACETLNPDGFRFLVELKAPLTDQKGDHMAPLALAIETYCRNPESKHAIMKMFAACGYDFPDTPLAAFHRGDLGRLQKFLRQDPGLIGRRFSLREIYPAELGCANEGRSGMNGTPLDGTTLLHLAIDFDEQEIFEWLLQSGADVNARATVDAEGFGGQTPMFNAVVSCACCNGRQRDARMIRRLLEKGAAPEIRTNLRKFLDWREEPGWHVARNVTAAEWARDFPERSWVNAEGLRLLS